jgi:Tfp pilus assembly protein PilE
MVRAYEAWKAEIKRTERAEMVQRRIAETMRSFERYATRFSIRTVRCADCAAIERCKVKFKEMGYEDVDIDPVMTTDNPQVASYLKAISYSAYCRSISSAQCPASQAPLISCFRLSTPI